MYYAKKKQRTKKEKVYIKISTALKNDCKEKYRKLSILKCSSSLSLAGGIVIYRVFFLCNFLFLKIFCGGKKGKSYCWLFLEGGTLGGNLAPLTS